MFHIIISYFNTYIFFRNVVVIFVFSYHVANLAVVLKNLQAGARAQKKILHCLCPGATRQNTRNISHNFNSSARLCEVNWSKRVFN